MTGLFNWPPEEGAGPTRGGGRASQRRQRVQVQRAKRGCLEGDRQGGGWAFLAGGTCVYQGLQMEKSLSSRNNEKSLVVGAVKGICI